MKYLLIVLLAVFAAAPFSGAYAQDAMTAQEKLALSRKENKVNSAIEMLEKKHGKVSRMYAKTETSSDYNKKTGAMEKSEVFNVEQEMLYNKGLSEYFKMTFEKMKATKDLDEQQKVVEHLDVFLDQMESLRGKNTKKLEKQLKKAEGSDEIYQLIMAAEA